MNVITGKVWKFGDNIDTDLIIAARYLNTSDPHELAKHVMEDADPDFVKKMQPGGSSREHAPIALKAAGVAAVVAKSFARIFYRNAFNMGLPIFELKDTDRIEAGDLVSIEMDKGNIIDLNREITYRFRPIPEFMRELLACGGLMNYAKAEMLKRERA